jgi:hypothetical protein
VNARHAKGKRRVDLLLEVPTSLFAGGGRSGSGGPSLPKGRGRPRSFRSETKHRRGREVFLPTIVTMGVPYADPQFDNMGKPPAVNAGPECKRATGVP